MSGRRLSVLHVTESYGGGVAAAIRDYRRNSPQAEHHLIYAPRADAPIAASDLAGFASVTEMGASHVDRIRQVRSRARAFADVTIHAHSSFGGAYARLAVRKSLRRRIVYTPHCYAFERRDLNRVKRLLFWLIEWVLAFNTTLFAGCSAREVQLSAWPLAASKRLLVPNVFPTEMEEPKASGSSGNLLRIAGAGRLGPQKDPDFFACYVNTLRTSGRPVIATWIGGGDPSVEKTLQDAGISVTGWLSREDVQIHLRKADVYVHSALWEGFPLAVLESSALSVATVVRDIPAFKELPEGLKAEASLNKLLGTGDDAQALAAWQLENVTAWRAYLQGNNNAQQAKALEATYLL